MGLFGIREFVAAIHEMVKGNPSVTGHVSHLASCSILTTQSQLSIPVLMTTGQTKKATSTRRSVSGRCTLMDHTWHGAHLNATGSSVKG